MTICGFFNCPHPSIRTCGCGKEFCSAHGEVTESGGSCFECQDVWDGGDEHHKGKHIIMATAGGLGETLNTLGTVATGPQINGKISDRKCADSETLFYKAAEFLGKCKELGVKGIVVLVAGDVMQIEIVGHPHSDISTFLHQLGDAVENEGIRVNFVMPTLPRREALN